MINRATVTDAIVFWETGRLGYNGVLAAVVMAFAIATDSWMNIAHGFGMIIMLSAAANVLYCAVYPIDLIAQATPWRETWRRHRWIVWVLGMLFAVFLAVLVTFGIGTLSLPTQDAIP